MSHHYAQLAVLFVVVAMAAIALWVALFWGDDQ